MVADRFRLRYKLTPEHFQSYLKFAAKRARRGRSKARFLRPLLLGLLVGLLLLGLDRAGYLSARDVSVLFAGAFLAVLFVAILAVIENRKMVRGMVGSHDAMIGNFGLAAYDGGGIQITGKHMQSSFDWTAFLDVTQESDILVIWVDRGVGVILPNSAFSDDEERHAFVAFVKERIEAQKTTDEFPASG